jgi:hypothetical protein
MERTELLKNLSGLLKGLDADELRVVADQVNQNVAERRPGFDLSDIKPGMTPEQRAVAVAEIGRVAQEAGH